MPQENSEPRAQMEVSERDFVAGIASLSLDMDYSDSEALAAITRRCYERLDALAKSAAPVKFSEAFMRQAAEDEPTLGYTAAQKQGAGEKPICGFSTCREPIMRNGNWWSHAKGLDDDYDHCAYPAPAQVISTLASQPAPVGFEEWFEDNYPIFAEITSKLTMAIDEDAWQAAREAEMAREVAGAAWQAALKSQPAVEALTEADLTGAINNETFDHFVGRIYDMATRGKTSWLREDLLSFVNNNREAYRQRGKQGGEDE